MITVNVIHNEKSVSRWESFCYEMARQEGVEIDVKAWPAMFDRRAYRGISRAHKSIVTYARNERLPEVLIMEDDIRIPAKDGIKYFLDNKPDDFDVYLGGVYSGGVSNNTIVKVFSGLHCYIVSARFYDTFLKADPNKHLDRALGGSGKFVVCSPFAAIQYNGFSENTGKEENYDHYLTGKKIYGIG